MSIKTLFRRGARYPRLGIIRLGVKAKNAQGKEYPKEVPYFVLPPDLAEHLPPQPTAIEVSFPGDDPERVFDVWFTRYDGPQLAVKCDGETCLRIGKDGSQAESPCEKPELGKCACGAKALGRLNVIVRRSKTFGVYQVLIGGEGRCRDLMSELQMYAHVARGLSRAWFTLERVKATEQAVKDDGSRMARTGYPVHLRLHYSPDLLLGPMAPGPKALSAPPAPEESPAGGNEIGDDEAAVDAPDDERQVALDELWTVYFQASGQDATKAAALSIKSVKKILDLDVAGLADLTLAQIKELSEKVYR